MNVYLVKMVWYYTAYRGAKYVVYNVSYSLCSSIFSFLGNQFSKKEETKKKDTEKIENEYILI
jgi:hypothetical protein